ncbi:MAG TPA: hypothetical protein VEW42_00650 [Candidatus Eisenbacteria bacterium]|nr:hypothetical protein [Candidatus Eisenbacteria bacterium]
MERPSDIPLCLNGQACRRNCRATNGASKLAQLKHTDQKVADSSFSPVNKTSAHVRLTGREADIRKWMRPRCLQAGARPLGPFERPENPPKA